MRFAQILDNKVHWIFEADKKPEFAPYIILKDITNVTPQPAEGWYYDAVKDSYSETAPATKAEAAEPTLAEIQSNQLVIMDALADFYTKVSAASASTAATGGTK